MIFNKLPAEIRISLEREHRSTGMTLKEICRSIFDEWDYRKADKTVTKIMLGKNWETFENPNTTAAFLTKSRQRQWKVWNIQTNDYNKPVTNSLSTKWCVYCHDQPSSFTCIKIVDQKARMSIVKRERLSSNCLGHHNLS